MWPYLGGSTIGGSTVSNFPQLAIALFPSDLTITVLPHPLCTAA